MTIEEAKKLKPDEINHVIAEAVGWKIASSHGSRVDTLYWVKPNGTAANIPDYFNDLNACHEVESGLNAIEQDRHYDILRRLLLGKHDILYECATAPANIRAIALAVVLSERGKK